MSTLIFVHIYVGTHIDKWGYSCYYVFNNKTTQHKHNEARSTKRLRRCKLRKVIMQQLKKW